MEITGDFPIHGTLRWLRPDEGGRHTGVPATPPDQVYAATGFVPPADITDGLASILIDRDHHTAWEVAARARWLVDEHAPTVQPGDVIVITEGPRIVAHLTVGAKIHDHSRGQRT